MQCTWHLMSCAFLILFHTCSLCFLSFFFFLCIVTPLVSEHISLFLDIRDTLKCQHLQGGLLNLSWTSLDSQERHSREQFCPHFRHLNTWFGLHHHPFHHLHGGSLPIGIFLAHPPVCTPITFGHLVEVQSPGAGTMQNCTEAIIIVNYIRNS